MLYLALKWLHLISMISWMAGILYLYRLFVNHVDAWSSKENRTLLEGMEFRLYKYITVPAMLGTYIGGLGMISLNHGMAQTVWFSLKFLLVFALSGLTGMAGSIRKKLLIKNDRPPMTSRRLRVMNEIPTVLMVVIVALAVFKPF